MPLVSLRKDALFFGKKCSDDQLSQKISMMGTPLEKMEGGELQVEIFPNRPDLLSEVGFVRSFRSFASGKLENKTYKSSPSQYHVVVDAVVDEVRPFTVCAVVKNLVFTDAGIRDIIQIQEKLHMTFCRKRKKAAIGMYPLEKIAFPVTYTAKKPEDIRFIPLDGKREMSGKQILDEHPTGREFAHLLDGKKVYPVFIDANKNILSMPPIINSEKMGRVDESTHALFVECTGQDLEVLQQCLTIISCALADLGGEVFSVTV